MGRGSARNPKGSRRRSSDFLRTEDRRDDPDGFHRQPEPRAKKRINPVRKSRKRPSPPPPRIDFEADDESPFGDRVVRFDDLEAEHFDWTRWERSWQDSDCDEEDDFIGAR